MFGVVTFINFNTLSRLPELFFPEGMGVYIILVEIPWGGGVGGLFLCSKHGNSGEERGAYMKFPLQ